MVLHLLDETIEGADQAQPEKGTAEVHRDALIRGPHPKPHRPPPLYVPPEHPAYNGEQESGRQALEYRIIFHFARVLPLRGFGRGSRLSWSENLFLSDLQTENRRTQVRDAHMNAGSDRSTVRGGIVKTRCHRVVVGIAETLGFHGEAFIVVALEWHWVKIRDSALNNRILTRLKRGEWIIARGENLPAHEDNPDDSESARESRGKPTGPAPMKAPFPNDEYRSDNEGHQAQQCEREACGPAGDLEDRDVVWHLERSLYVAAPPPVIKRGHFP
jgi:hypothetical protein